MEKALDLIFGIIMIAFDFIMIALPFLFLYAIYRVIKALMTHNANLKKRDNNDWTNR